MVNQQEIDGIRLFAKMKQIIRQRRGLIIFLFSLCIGAAVTIYFFKDPYYETKFTAKSKVLTFQMVENLIDPLNTHVKQKDYLTLSKKISIDIQTAKAIKSFESNELKRGEFLSNKDFIVQSNIRIEYSSDFEILVEVYDNSILKKLQKGIVAYLGNNNFVEKEKAFYNEVNLGYMLRIEDQIVRLDSIQKLLPEILAQKEQASIIDVGSFYTGMLHLTERKYQLIKQIKFIDDIQVVGDFAVFSKTTAPKLYLYLVNGILIGLLLSIFVVIILEINSIIKKYEQEQG